MQHSDTLRKTVWHSGARFFSVAAMGENKFYVTKQGLEKVKSEHEKLRDFKRQKTMGEMPNLLHSEEANPEYLSFQEDMSLLDAKIVEYENILNNVELIVLPKKEWRDRVCVGAIVTLELNGVLDEFMLVGTIEADPAQKKISNESPIGKALLGAKIGSMVKLTTAIINHTCKVLNIRYE